MHEQVNLRIYRTILTLLLGLFCLAGAYAQQISRERNSKGSDWRTRDWCHVLVKGRLMERLRTLTETLMFSADKTAYW